MTNDDGNGGRVDVLVTLAWARRRPGSPWRWPARSSCAAGASSWRAPATSCAGR